MSRLGSLCELSGHSNGISWRRRCSVLQSIRFGVVGTFIAFGCCCCVFRFVYFVFFVVKCRVGYVYGDWPWPQGTTQFESLIREPRKTRRTRKKSTVPFLLRADLFLAASRQLRAASINQIWCCRHVHRCWRLLLRFSFRVFRVFRG